MCVLKIFKAPPPKKVHNIALDISCATCHLRLPGLRKFLKKCSSYFKFCYEVISYNIKHYTDAMVV